MLLSSVTVLISPAIAIEKFTLALLHSVGEGQVRPNQRNCDPTPTYFACVGKKEKKKRKKRKKKKRKRENKRKKKKKRKREKQKKERKKKVGLGIGIAKMRDINHVGHSLFLV